MTATLPPCTNCGGPRRPRSGAHDWCQACYHRWWRAGRPNDGPPPTAEQRRTEYAFLRSQGIKPHEAAEQVGVSSEASVWDYEREAPAAQPVPLGWTRPRGPACDGTDPALWFSEHPDDIARAKAICRTCPVLLRCWTHAVRHEPAGVWAGTTAEERDEVRAQLAELQGAA